MRAAPSCGWSYNGGMCERDRFLHLFAILLVMTSLAGCHGTKQQLEKRGFEFHGAKLLRVFRF